MGKLSSKRTQESLLKRLLSLPELLSDQALLERLNAEGSSADGDHADIALLVAAAEAYLSSALYARRAFFAAAARGRPKSSHESPITVDCRLRGEKYRLIVQRISPNRYRLEVEGKTIVMSMTPVNEFESCVSVGDRSYRVVSITQGKDHLIEVDNVIHRISRGDVGMIRSPSPSLVVAVNVKPGDTVAKGDSLVVLEAMKMETSITAPFAGTVVDVLTGPSIQVDAGAGLIRLEVVTERDDSERVGGHVMFDGTAAELTSDPSAHSHCLKHLDAILWTVLGYDTKAGLVRDLAGRLLKAQSEIDLHDPQIVAAGLEVLAAFSDVNSLARNRPLGDMLDEETRNPKEHFHHYLRSLDLAAEGLPESFRRKLERAFAHYGVESLLPCDDLERAAFRAFNAQQVATAHEPLVAAVLTGLRLDPERLDQATAQRLRFILDEFVVATELRFPNLGNKARNIRYQNFEQPAVAARKTATLDEMRGHIATLRTADAAAHLEAVINCPEAVIELLADPDESGNNGDPMLDVMFRRFYRVKELQNVQELAGIRSACYLTDGERRCVVAAITPQGKAGGTLRAALEHGRTLSDSQPLSIDIYNRWDGSVAADAVETWAQNIDCCGRSAREHPPGDLLWSRPRRPGLPPHLSSR